MESAIIAILISLGIGAVAYIVTNSNIPTGTIKVSRREFLIGMAISTLILIIAALLTEHLIISNKERYYEYLNGYETAATVQVTICERDGDCDNTYDCDPYLVVHTYTDSKGLTHTYVTTEYHHCPYLTHELHYTVSTTLGDYPIGGAFADKQRTAWRSGEAVPSDIPTGPPKLWAEAKARLDSGKPGGATKVHEYKNFLLASDQTILDQYSADIGQYKQKGLLPPHTRNYDNPIYNKYQADKFSAVKLNVDLKAWNEALSRLNGYLGKELQGDVHMAAVDAGRISNQDDYSQALFAYWKSPQNFQHYALPKNALAIVVGVRGGKIAWARATGGLPVGNEALFTDIQNNLVGVAFTPDAVIGIPKKTPGVLTQTIYGVHKFNRPCMECIGKKTGGYAYLKSDIYVTGWQRFWIVFVAATLSAGMWAIFLYADDSFRGTYY
jgi:hypothetical protein